MERRGVRLTPSDGNIINIYLFAGSAKEIERHGDREPCRYIIFIQILCITWDIRVCVCLLVRVLKTNISERLGLKRGRG